MPTERIKRLVTIAGVLSWKKKGQDFRVRYDLVKLGVNSGAPAYNAIYIVDGEENILVSSNPRPTGFVENRQISLWPGVLKSHHQKYGDGTMLVFDPETQRISTWKEVSPGVAELVETGFDLPEEDEEPEEDQPVS